MSTILSRLERVYVKPDVTFGTIPTFGNSNALRHIKVTMDNDIALLIRRDKTGSRSATQGVRGRGFGKWSYEGSMAPSGVNGTIPDFDPIFQALFGQASASAGGGVQYTFADTPIVTFSMASYRQPSTVNQRIAFGCTVDEATFNVGQDIAEWTATGESKFVLESDYFSSASTEEKGGLGGFPSEPGSPVTNGGIIAGFTGSVSMGGTSIARLRTAVIKVKPQNVLIKDTFGHYLPDDTAGDVRIVTVVPTLYEEDVAGVQALHTAAITKAPLDMSFTIGTVAGSIVNFALKNVQLMATQYDDSGLRYSNSFGESRAFGTSITSKDEIVITIT